MISGKGSCSAWKRSRVECASWLWRRWTEWGFLRRRSRVGVGAIIGGADAAGINGRATCESSIASLEQSLRCDQRVVASVAGRFADLVLLGRGNLYC